MDVNQIFRDLTEKRYATVTKREDLSTAVGPYGNGGAQATYATQPFEAMGGMLATSAPGRCWWMASRWRPSAARGAIREGRGGTVAAHALLSLPDGANPAEAGQRSCWSIRRA